MPVDFTAPEGASAPTTEGTMFAPTPVWARDAKKRRRSARPAARRTFSDSAMAAGATTVDQPLDTPLETFEARPPRRNGMAIGAIAVGVVAVAALGAVGWHVSQPRSNGVAELTPGAPAASQIALNTAAPATSPMSAAAGPAAPTAGDTTTTRESTTTTAQTASASAPVHHTAKSVATRAPAPRVRPAEGPSAMDAGTDASATAPTVDTPRPSPAMTPDAATAAAPPGPSATPPGSTSDSSTPTANAPVNPTATP